MVFSSGNLLLRLSTSLILIVINSALIHYIAEKLKFKDNSFDNPTTIAIILSVFFLGISFVRMKFIFFLITLIAMVASVQIFYKVKWEEAIKLTLIWLVSIIVLSFALASLLFILVF
jgi:hypothetical protein